MTASCLKTASVFIIQTAWSTGNRNATADSDCDEGDKKKDKLDLAENVQQSTESKRSQLKDNTKIDERRLADMHVHCIDMSNVSV